MTRLCTHILYRTLIAIAMITVVLIASVVFGVMARAQTVISNTAVQLQIPDHPEHASVHDMGTEQSLLTGTYSTAAGDLPLAEVYHPAPEIPLGTIARICRDDTRDPRCAYQNK
jgi:hypothetical protein